LKFENTIDALELEEITKIDRDRWIEMAGKSENEVQEGLFC
tara:strand:- start:19813 stop:19935 length:123 start_codon:yes stop_codon:yes gene_type:complete